LCVPVGDPQTDRGERRLVRALASAHASNRAAGTATDNGLSSRAGESRGPMSAPASGRIRSSPSGPAGRSSRRQTRREDWHLRMVKAVVSAQRNSRSWSSASASLQGLSRSRRETRLRSNSRSPVATDESQGSQARDFGGPIGRGPVVQGLRAPPVRSVRRRRAASSSFLSVFAQRSVSPGWSGVVLLG